MLDKLTSEELNTIIANAIREKGLNDAFDDKVIDKIRGNILKTFGTPEEKVAKEEILEGGEELIPSPEFSEPAEVAPEQQMVGHTVELPEFLSKIEPAKIVVCDENELSHGGENMSRVAYRLMEDPDKKSTMRDFWLKEGKRKAEVYIARFEKIGDIEYNHMDGTSRFSNLNKIDEIQPSNYSNPYQDSSSDESKKREIEAFIKSSVDLESLVKDKIEDILANYFNKISTDKAVVNGGYQDLDMTKIASGDDFIKVDTPIAVAENIGGKKNFSVSLIAEGSDFNVFEFEGREFILPKNPINTRKCYIRQN